MQLGAFPNKRKAPKPNGPLRTVQELADEFGVSVQAFCGALTAADAPKAWSKYGTNPWLTQRTYYEADVVRAWWQKRAAVTPGARTRARGAIQSHAT